MKISEEGLDLIKKFEGCETKAYLCPAGVWTIGYGHTKDVKEGEEISEDYAMFLLKDEIVEYEKYIEDLVEVSLSQCEFDALCSWVYNLGPTNLKESTLLKELNHANFDRVPFEIKRWNKAGGKVLEGLQRRREAEALLFEAKDWSKV
tara:strand:- start:1463 stop:1906 length:444 start_codon:yes stop_codon:yes gene_type:complete